MNDRYWKAREVQDLVAPATSRMGRPFCRSSWKWVLTQRGQLFQPLADSMGRSKWWGPIKSITSDPLISIGLRSKRPLICEKIVADRVVRVKREARAFSQRRIGATESSEASARSNLHQLQMLLTLSRCIDSFKKGAVPVSWQLARIVEVGRVRLPVVTGEWQSMMEPDRLSAQSERSDFKMWPARSVEIKQSFSPCQLCSMWLAQCPACRISTAGWLECHFLFPSVQRGSGTFGYGVLRLERVEGHVARSKGDPVASCDEQLWHRL
jgi:hypothetical protein